MLVGDPAIFDMLHHVHAMLQETITTGSRPTDYHPDLAVFVLISFVRVLVCRHII